MRVRVCVPSLSGSSNEIKNCLMVQVAVRHNEESFWCVCVCVCGMCVCVCQTDSQTDRNIFITILLLCSIQYCSPDMPSFFSLIHKFHDAYMTLNKKLP